MVWPPPSEETEKKEVRVGKLEIDEKVARGIENRIVGKKKWQKPPAPEHQQQQQQQASPILKKGKEVSGMTYSSGIELVLCGLVSMTRAVSIVQ